MEVVLLNPYLLIGLLAISLPVIAHMIARRGGRKLPFSAAMFLDPSSTRSSGKLVPTDIPLLLLRALLLALVVLAFTRPALLLPTGHGVEAPLDLAIVVDNSMSMRWGGTFQGAVDAAEEMIDSLADGSLALILPTVPDTRSTTSPELTGDKAGVRAQLRAIAPTYRRAPAMPALLEAYGAIDGGPNSLKRVVLVWDGQSTAWGDQSFAPPWLRVVTIGEGEPRPNAALTHIEAEHGEDGVVVTALVESFSGAPRRGARIMVTTGTGEIIRLIDITPGSPGEHRFVFPPGTVTGGVLPFEAQLATDDLAADDSRFFAHNTAGVLRALIVEGDVRQDPRQSEGFYLVRALAALAEETALVVTGTTVDGLQKHSLAGVGVIILANVSSLGTGKAAEIERFVASGGTLVVFTGERTKGATMSRLLQGVLPGELGSPVTGPFTLERSAEEGWAFLSEDLLAKVRLERLTRVLPHRSAGVILSTREGYPVLLRRDVGAGRTYLFTTSADLEWGDLALTPLYLPTIMAIMGSSGKAGAPSPRYLTGDVVETPPRRDGGGATVTAPDGSTSVLGPGETAFVHTDLPGIYTVSAGGDEYGFAVNVDPRESDLARLEPQEPPREGARDAPAALSRTEVWPYLVWAALLTLAAEGAVLWAGVRRRRA